MVAWTRQIELNVVESVQILNIFNVDIIDSSDDYLADNPPSRFHPYHTGPQITKNTIPGPSFWLKVPYPDIYFMLVIMVLISSSLLHHNLLYSQLSIEFRSLKSSFPLKDLALVKMIFSLGTCKALFLKVELTYISLSLLFLVLSTLYLMNIQASNGSMPEKIIILRNKIYGRYYFKKYYPAEYIKMVIGLAYIFIVKYFHFSLSVRGVSVSFAYIPHIYVLYFFTRRA